MEERDHLVNVLQQASEAIKRNDVAKLKELSDQTIHAASIHKDTDSISVATIIYSIGKVLERDRFKKVKGCAEFCGNVGRFIEEAVSALKKGDEVTFKNKLQEIISSVKKLSPNLRKNVEDVFRKAQINKASKIYEHGISMENTANLLGITMFELAGYSGQKGTADVPEAKTVDVKTRIKFAMDMFT
jgi:DNA-binding XRE family transcriptional regulator